MRVAGYRSSPAVSRLRTAAVALLAMGLCVGAAPAVAAADTPAHTDVMFVFDTTGSMGGALE